MQRHCPMAAAGLQSAADRVRSGRHPLETYRQILMIGSLADEAAAEMAIITDVTVNHRCALERIEPEPVFGAKKLPITGLPLSCGGEPGPRARAHGQLAGFRTCRPFRLALEPTLLLAAASQSFGPVLLTTFVSAHRCGTVLDFHQVPFCTLGSERNRETNRETCVSERADGKQEDPIGFDKIGARPLLTRRVTPTGELARSR